MIDHLTFGVAELDRSMAFYDVALAPLSMGRVVTLSAAETGSVRIAAYGAADPCLWLAEERPTRGLMHIALVAPDRAAVAAFHAAAIGAGGVDNGPPGPRPQYHRDYYAAFVLDPDGHNIEAVCRVPRG